MTDSNVINAALNLFDPAFDQRGFARPWGAGNDIGSVERVGTDPVDSDGDNVFDPGDNIGRDCQRSFHGAGRTAKNTPEKKHCRNSPQKIWGNPGSPRHHHGHQHCQPGRPRAPRTSDPEPVQHHWKHPPCRCCFRWKPYTGTCGRLYCRTESRTPHGWNRTLCVSSFRRPFCQEDQPYPLRRGTLQEGGRRHHAAGRGGRTRCARQFSGD